MELREAAQPQGQQLMLRAPQQAILSKLLTIPVACQYLSVPSRWYTHTILDAEDMRQTKPLATELTF